MTSANSRTNNITKALLVIYLAALCWVLLFKLGVRFSYMEERRVNLIPFNGLITRHGKINPGEIIMNVLVFIPFGIYAGVLFQRWSFVNKLFFFLSASFLFEALQLIIKAGAFDVTDIFANTLGGMMGLMICFTIRKLFNNDSKAQHCINVFSGIATVLMISLLLLLKLNMLPIRYQ